MTLKFPGIAGADDNIQGLGVPFPSTSLRCLFRPLPQCPTLHAVHRAPLPTSTALQRSPCHDLNSGQASEVDNNECRKHIGETLLSMGKGASNHMV
eukprot:2464615-Amphidinium_carterae.1